MAVTVVIPMTVVPTVAMAMVAAVAMTTMPMTMTAVTTRRSRGHRGSTEGDSGDDGERDLAKHCILQTRCMAPVKMHMGRAPCGNSSWDFSERVVRRALDHTTRIRRSAGWICYGKAFLRVTSEKVFMLLRFV